MVNQTNLLRKLHRFGLDDKELNWFENLMGPAQRCSMECVSSESDEITVDVTQGTILGPLVFVIYMNNFPNVQTNSQTLIMLRCT